MKYSLNTVDPTLRVFVSSTFEDMHHERNELVSRVFPNLRELCEKRGVTCSEIDLRWGITEESAAEGKILPICLAEIDRCRPFFIGILGERYGHIPREISSDLIESHPWLTEYCEHSVTEIEICHGALRNPELAKHAYFYFRHRDFVSMSEFGNQTYDVKKALSPSEKQKALKEKIKSSKLPIREGYRTVSEFGDWVLRDLTAAINAEFPETVFPGVDERENHSHRVYASIHGSLYTGGKQYLKRLNNHVRESGAPLVVTGEPGFGKTALLSAWSQQDIAVGLKAGISVSVTNPASIIMVRFIGTTKETHNWKGLIRSIIYELQRNFDIEEDIPEKPGPLRGAFRECLKTAVDRGLEVLIIDGLDALDSRDNVPDLRWLPVEFSPQLRVVIASRSGNIFDALVERGWPTFEIQPLITDERKQFIIDYLANFRKSLSTTRIDRIATTAATGNPTFLRTVLDELRIIGKHHELDSQLNEYLAAVTPQQLFDKVLIRYEQDYDRDRPGLVRDIFSLLCVTTQGISEDELLDLLGSDGQPLPASYWSPIYLAAQNFLTKQYEYIKLVFEPLRLAATARYLAEPEELTRVQNWLTGECQTKAFRLITNAAKPGLDSAYRGLLLSYAWKLLLEAKTLEESLGRIRSDSDPLLVVPGGLFVVTAYFSDKSSEEYYRELVQLAHKRSNKSAETFWLNIARGCSESNPTLRGTLDTINMTADIQFRSTILEIQHKYSETVRNEDDTEDSDDLPELGATGNIYLEARATSEKGWEKRIAAAHRKGPEHLLRVLKWQGFAYRGAGEFIKAIKVFDDMERIAREAGKVGEVFEIYNEKALAATMDENNNLVLDILSQEEAYARHINDEQRISQCLQKQENFKRKIDPLNGLNTEAQSTLQLSNSSNPFRRVWLFLLKVKNWYVWR